MKLFWLFLVVSSLTYADTVYRLKKSNEQPVCGQTNIVLNNLPPIRDQGSYGTCYAHSSVLLLEHLRCSKSDNPLMCYQEKGSVLHLARFQNSDSNDAIKIGGDAEKTLTNFKIHRQLSKETCAPYEAWENLSHKYKDEIKKLNLPPVLRHETDYFFYISDLIRSNATTEQKECWAQEILDAGVNQDFQDIFKILDQARNLSWEELRYKILVPTGCMDTPLKYPEYEIVKYPNVYNHKKTFKEIRDQVYRSLAKGYPLEVSFCATKDSDGKCFGHHSSTIVGQRHVCSKEICRLQFKIQNSYGRGWQFSNDDGWVDAENLSQHMDGNYLGLLTTLPKGEELDDSLVAPYFTKLPNSGKTLLDNCWKVNENDLELISEDKTTPRISPKTNTQTAPRESGKFYSCRGPNGEFYSGDTTIAGWNCKEIKI